MLCKEMEKFFHLQVALVALRIGVGGKKKYHYSWDIYGAIWLYFNKNFMASSYGWGSTASRLEPLRGGSLLFTTKFPEINVGKYISGRQTMYARNFV